MNRMPASMSSRSCLQQPDDLCRHGHVERLGDVVADQEARLGHQRIDDHRPLQHAARILVRELVDSGARRTGYGPDRAGPRRACWRPSRRYPAGRRAASPRSACRPGWSDRTSCRGRRRYSRYAGHAGPAARRRASRTGRGRGTEPDHWCARAAAGYSRPRALARIVLPEPALADHAQIPARSATVEADVAQHRPALAAALQLDRRPLTSSSGGRPGHQIVPRSSMLRARSKRGAHQVQVTAAPGTGTGRAWSRSTRR